MSLEKSNVPYKQTPLFCLLGFHNWKEIDGTEAPEGIFVVKFCPRCYEFETDMITNLGDIGKFYRLKAIARVQWSRSLRR